MSLVGLQLSTPPSGVQHLSGAPEQEHLYLQVVAASAERTELPRARVRRVRAKPVQSSFRMTSLLENRERMNPPFVRSTCLHFLGDNV